MGAKVAGKRKASVAEAPVAAMTEASSPVGVCTRGKTLALRQAAVCYLELRSRRLEKRFPAARRRALKPPKSSPKPSLESNAAEEKAPESSGSAAGVARGHNSPALLVSRNERECSPLGTSLKMATPDSSNNTTNSTSCRRHSDVASKVFPSIADVDKVIRPLEDALQKSFEDKYNFDIRNDKPLPGRYEWKKT